MRDCWSRMIGSLARGVAHRRLHVGSYFCGFAAGRATVTASPASPTPGRASRLVQRGAGTPGASLPTAACLMDLHPCVIDLSLADIEGAESLMCIAPLHIDAAACVIGIKPGHTDPDGRLIDLSFFDMDRAGPDTGRQPPKSVLRHTTWAVPRRRTMLRCPTSGFHRSVRILRSRAPLRPAAANEVPGRVACLPATVRDIAVRVPIDPPPEFPEHRAPT